MTSALPTRPMPPPTQKPLTAATTGTSHSYTARNASKQPRLASISAVKPSVVLHLLDVDARVEPAALGPQDHHVGGLVAARGA